MQIIISFIVIAVGLAIYVIFIYNSLVKKRQMVDNGWSDIAVQLKRRAELIPNIVSAVKAYARHERQLFEEISEKRTQALAAGDDAARRGQAETALSQPVSKLFALAEDYPDLKANTAFLDLQNELAETEDKIEMARRFFNGAVRELNIGVRQFPASIIASAFGFRVRDFFEIAASDVIVPSVDFNAEADNGSTQGPGA